MTAKPASDLETGRVRHPGVPPPPTAPFVSRASNLGPSALSQDMPQQPAKRLERSPFEAVRIGATDARRLTTPRAILSCRALKRCYDSLRRTRIYTGMHVSRHLRHV